MAGLLDALLNGVNLPSVGLLGAQKSLPMRLPYGQRWNEATQRFDSPQNKGIGFYGPLNNGPNDIASEYSTGSEIGDYPSIAQNMPPVLLAKALSAARFHQPVLPEVADFAENSARTRMANGSSPFFDQKTDQYPAWSPDQYWPAPAIMGRR